MIWHILILFCLVFLPMGYASSQEDVSSPLVVVPFSMEMRLRESEKEVATSDTKAKRLMSDTDQKQKKKVSTPLPVESQKVLPLPVLVVGTTIVNLRMGTHPGRTRLVLDMDGPMPHNEVMDETESVLLITLPEAKKWQASQNKTPPKGGHILGYTVSTDSQGAHIAIELQPGTHLIKTETIGAEKNMLPRLVFDFGER